MNNQSRNSTLDVVKGIGILLVVLSHTLSKSEMNATTLFGIGLFDMITSFFMLCDSSESSLIKDVISSQRYDSHVDEWFISIHSALSEVVLQVSGIEI